MDIEQIITEIFEKKMVKWYILKMKQILINVDYNPLLFREMKQKKLFLKIDQKKN